MKVLLQNIYLKAHNYLNVFNLLQNNVRMHFELVQRTNTYKPKIPRENESIYNFKLKKYFFVP